MSIELVVFDVDGTLTRHDSIWWRLHQLFGTEEEGKRYHDMYFAGEITYDEWARLDAGLWRGQPLSRVLDAVHDTELVIGARETVEELRRYGVHTAILSGGLDLLAEHVARQVGIEYVRTNRLHHQNGLITGEVEVHVRWDNKDEVLRQIAHHFGIPLRKTAFVGDSRNDLSAFSVVGLPIAFMPTDDEVADAAMVTIREYDLRLILPYILNSSTKYSSGQI